MPTLDRHAIAIAIARRGSLGHFLDRLSVGTQGASVVDRPICPGRRATSCVRVVVAVMADQSLRHRGVMATGAVIGFAQGKRGKAMRLPASGAEPTSKPGRAASAEFGRLLLITCGVSLAYLGLSWLNWALFKRGGIDRKSVV